MTITVADFRTNFPAFTDPTKYPDPQIQFYLDLGLKLLNVERFGDVLDYALQLFIAHNLALMQIASASGANGGIPGNGIGVMNNKHVDKVSIGYDVNVGLSTDAGIWNRTLYGQMLYRLIQMFGAGPIQVTPGSGQLDPLTSALAWPGVINTHPF